MNVSVTFDNLGEASDLERGWWPEDEPLGRHFSVTRTLPRVLEALDEAGLRATFFVEGLNTELYPETLVELAQGVRIELRVEALDEERRSQPRRVERVEQPRQRPRDGVVPPERLVLGPPAALEVGGLAEVVEGDADRRGRHSAATGFSSRPTRSISTTMRSPSRSSTFGSRR